MPRPAKISVAIILEAAYRKIAEEGLDALSMRGLGKELGVEAMSLYKHVGRREELVARLRRELLSSISLPPPGGAARRDLEEVCLALWRGLTQQKGAALLLLSRTGAKEDEAPESVVGRLGAGREFDEPWLPVVERMLLPLRVLIPEPLDRAYAVHALFSFVLGQVAFGARSPSVIVESLAALALGPERFPELTSIQEALQSRSVEVEFELGLRALLDAMEGRRGF